MLCGQERRVSTKTTATPDQSEASEQTSQAPQPDVFMPGAMGDAFSHGNAAMQDFVCEPEAESDIGLSESQSA
jgi:hypothetical protein